MAAPKTDAYAKNYERLRRVKAAYDPDSVFRVNRNISAAADRRSPPSAYVLAGDTRSCADRSGSSNRTN
jgi:hypothetical protein